MKIFNINRDNRLTTCRIVDLTVKGKWIHIGHWISERILGKYISITVPLPKIFREKLEPGDRFLSEKEYDDLFPGPT